MQLSLLGPQRTQSLLERFGLTARVVEYSPFPFSALFTERKEQILRVEELSDAYHLRVRRRRRPGRLPARGDADLVGHAVGPEILRRGGDLAQLQG